jgi:uncharacterized protein YqgC (DUF456 family)
METVAYTLGGGLVILGFVVGLFGIFLPIIPGLLIIWLSALFYAAVVVGFDAFSPWVFVLITLIALVAGTANIWLAALGARTTGASWRTLIVGFVGAIAGTFLIPIPLLGTILGYAGGLIASEYVRLGQWRPAMKAAFGGVVGWGVSTAVELIGAVVMILLVASQVPR